MVTLDRIRLTGLLRKKPWKRGFFYSVVSPGSRPTSCYRLLGRAISLEPLGAGAGFAPCRTSEVPAGADGLKAASEKPCWSLLASCGCVLGGGGGRGC